MSLASALFAVIVLIMALTWVVFQVQITLAGFLNSESLWSKAQKQAVIDLGNYAVQVDAASLAGFRRNCTVLDPDRLGRDAIASGKFDRAFIDEVFSRGSIMPAARPGMLFMLQHFAAAPHLDQALATWRSTDDKIAELNKVSHQLERAYATGAMSAPERARQREYINAVNRFIEPRTQLFSIEVVNGAIWLGQVLFWGVLSAFLAAALLWIRMARRILESIRGSEERYRPVFDSAADAIVMIDETSGRILDVNRAASTWTSRPANDRIGDRFVHLFTQQLQRKEGRQLTGARFSHAYAGCNSFADACSGAQ